MGEIPQGLQGLLHFMLHGDFDGVPTELLELRRKSGECITKKQF